MEQCLNLVQDEDKDGRFLLGDWQWQLHVAHDFDRFSAGHSSHLCLHSSHPSSSSSPANMSEPTKAETEQVFKVLKAQKGNKVRPMALMTPECD